MRIGVPKGDQGPRIPRRAHSSERARSRRARADVLVETAAAERIGVSDDDYRKAGAKIAETAAEVFAKSEFIVKVKEPQPRERELLQVRRSSPIFTWRPIPIKRRH
jgi:alanine dehydrogenase